MTHFLTKFWHRLLRDWFAGQALAGICANGSGPPNESDAELAYRIADAMLLAREERKDHQDKPGPLRIA